MIFRRAVKKKNKSTAFPNMKKGGVFGHNHFAVITKSIALRTGMLKPEKCTPSARRRAGITRLANKANAVPENTRMRAARHTVSTTHAVYQDITPEMMQGRYKAFMYNDQDYGKFNVCRPIIYHVS
jgi:integrase